MSDFAGWVDSTPDVGYGEQYNADRAAEAARIADPRACLKRVYARIEEMPLSKMVLAHSLYEVSMAQIVLALIDDSKEFWRTL